MELDYRTSVKSDSECTSSTVFVLIYSSVIGLVAVFVLRLAAVFTTTWLFLTATFLLGSILALLLFLAYGYPLRRALIWALIGPALCLCSHITTAFPFAFLLLIPLVVAAWLAHQVVTHYASWMHAHPQLDRKTRKSWQRLWSPENSSNDKTWRPISFSEHLRSLVQPPHGSQAPHEDPISAAETTERHHYPFGLAIVFVAYLIAVLVLFLVPGPFVNAMVAVFTFILVLIAWGVYDVSQYDRRIDPVLAARLVWKAIVSWFNYNSHNTQAPGVFQSPHGWIGGRHALGACALIALSMTVLPLASYFPVGMIPLGINPWLAASNAPLPWEGQPTDRTYPESRNARTEGRSTTPGEQAYLQNLPPAARGAYRESRARLQTQQNATRTAYARLLSSPEAVVFSSVRGAATGSSVVIGSLFFSLLACIFTPPLLLFAICFAVGGRLITHHWLTLQGDRRHPARYHQEETLSSWAAYTTRLRGSQHETQDHHGEPLRERDHLLLGVNRGRDYPILLDRKILEEHAHITGRTGAGKTSMALAPMLHQLIGRADSSVVVLDLNGDPSLFAAVKEAVRQANIGREKPLPFRWFTNFPDRSTYVFNPFLQSHIPQVTTQQGVEMILQSIGLEYGEGYGPAWFSSAHRHVLTTVLEQNPQLNSFRKLDDYLTNTLPTTRKDLGISSKSYEEASHLYTIMHSLASFDALNATPDDDYPTAVFQNRIDMSQVVKEPNVLYFSLTSPMQQQATSHMAKLALFSLLTAAIRRGPADFTVYVFIDEFQQIVNENVEVILRQARKNRLNCILSHQNLSQLNKPRAGNLIPTVQGNTRFRQVFSADDLIQQQAIMDASGEALYHMGSWFVSAGDFNAGYVEPATDDVPVRVSETIGPAVRRNDIIEVGDVEFDSLVHVTQGRGYTQYGGFIFPMRSEYHIPTSVYREREFASWPKQREGTIVPSLEGFGTTDQQQPTSSPPEAPGMQKDPTAQQRSRIALLDDLEDRIDEIEGVDS